MCIYWGSCPIISSAEHEELMLNRFPFKRWRLPPSQHPPWPKTTTTRSQCHYNQYVTRVSETELNSVKFKANIKVFLWRGQDHEWWTACVANVSRNKIGVRRHKNQAHEHNGQMMNTPHSNTPSVPGCINIAGIIFANIHFTCWNMLNKASGNRLSSRKSNTCSYDLPSCRTQYRRMLFFPRTIPNWNGLPQGVVTAESLDCFKSRLNSLL